MALVKCPGCGKEISYSAATCLNCGRAMPSSDDKNVQIQHDGSANSWMELFKTTPLNPGALLLFGGECFLDSFVAGWHLFVAGARISDTGKQIFTNVEHILPEKIGKRDILGNIKLALKKQTASWNLSKEQIKLFLDTMKVHRLSTLEGPDVIGALNHVQDESAVAISCVEVYRFPDIDGSSAFSVPMWLGIKYRWRMKKQIYFAHLMELTRQVLELAKEKKLFVTLFCEEYGLVLNEFPPDLQNHPNLAVLNVSAPNDYRSLETFHDLHDLVDRIETEGIDAVLASVTETVNKPENRALLTSYLLSANQQFDAAWTAVEPYLETLVKSDGTMLLSLSQRAMDAGRKSESEDLLNTAIERGIDSLEELHSAYLLARELSLANLSGHLFARMRLEYPNSKITLSLLYNNHFQAHDFSSALEVAERLGDTFRVQLCRAFATPNFDLIDFFEYAKEAGKLKNAYIAAACEAEYRHENLLAREWASKIGFNSEFSSDAIRIRTRIIGRMIRTEHEISESEVAELEQVMQFTATNPGNQDVRIEIEDLLESGLEEPAAILMLSTILLNNVRASFREIASHNFNFETFQGDVLNESDVEEGEVDLRRFWQEFLSSMQSSGVVIGRGKIPDYLKHLVSPRLLHNLTLTLQEASSSAIDNDSQFIYLLLHAIALSSRELMNPSSDFIAARTAIGYLANAGYAQTARDLAETSLLTLPRTQPDYLDWRTGQAWTCYADAFHRTGNTMAALRCLCLSFLSWEGSALNRILLSSSYRLAARFFRDLGLADFALEMTDLERQVWTMTDADEHFLRQLDQVELSIKMTKLGGDASPELLLEFLAKAAELLDQSHDDETAPLLACQANLIRLLKLEDVEIPSHIEKKFNERLGVLNESSRNLLSSIIISTPTKSDLLSAVQRVASANSFDDLAYQITPIRGLASSSVSAACQQKDIDLFVLASALLSQPALSLRMHGGSDSNLSPESVNMQRWWLQLLAESSQDTVKVADAHNVVQNIVPPLKKSIAQLSEVSLKQLQSVIQPDEAVMLLARDPAGNLCRAVIYCDSYLGPERLTEEIWSPMKYKEWRKFFPRSYGGWEPPEPFTEEKPSKEKVRDSVISLSVGNFKRPKLLSIIPDADLFGFPFVLAPIDQTYLGKDTQVGTVPSMPWFITTRSQPWKSNLSKKAWLGSPKSQDLTLHLLRERLQPSLEKYQVEIIESKLPDELAHSGLAIITSHGGVGFLDHFRMITDTTRTYSAKEFAHSLEGCGCVVLFVCNAGRSDPQIGSSETLGLVSELLRVNVRSVIASPWPLYVYVTETWLPAFLESLSNGYTVGYSAYMASKEVRNKYDNPCAWAALQVYGEPTFTLA